MKSKKIFAVLAVMLTLTFIVPVNAEHQTLKQERPIVYNGDDHPWGGETNDPGTIAASRIYVPNSDFIGTPLYFITNLQVVINPDLGQVSDDSGTNEMLPGEFTNGNERSRGNNQKGN